MQWEHHIPFSRQAAKPKAKANLIIEIRYFSKDFLALSFIRDLPFSKKTSFYRIPVGKTACRVLVPPASLENHIKRLELNMEKHTVKVWDPFVRFFHWALVLAIILQFVSAESSKTWHIRIGYFIIFLVLARIVWGFVGTRHARFTDFIYRPGAIFEYLWGLVRNKPKRYLGHNPAGGIMVVILLAALLVTTFTGLKALGAKGAGPFAGSQTTILSAAHADDDREHEDRYLRGARHGQTRQGNEIWKEIHETMTGVLLFLAIFHVCGVLASSWAHRENLIFGMLTGKKKVE